MDYTVGSLADLISGQNTPNKPKVREVPIKQNIKNKEIQTSKKVVKNKKSKNDLSSSLKNEESQVVVKKMKTGKRKLSTNEEPATKKQKIKKALAVNETLADSDEEIFPKDEKIDNEVTEANSDAQTKKKKSKVLPNPEEQERTIFVGNVPIKTTKKRIKKCFKKYGLIEAVRFRGIPVADPKITKKRAAIKQEFNPNRNSILCYIRFANKEDAQQALQEDGSIFEEHHLRVQSCISKEKPDETKAVFIGNLSFTAEEDELWKLFEPCGPISSVRIVRDSYTGMGKGFAYVNFKDSDAVQLALEMEKVMLKNRELRIKLSSVNTAKKHKKNMNAENAARRRGQGYNDSNRKIKKNEKSEFKSFQGSKFNNKKKFKVNKGALDKKWKMKKVAPI